MSPDDLIALNARSVDGGTARRDHRHRLALGRGLGLTRAGPHDDPAPGGRSTP